MSAWLSRPRHIDDGTSSFTFPSLCLEESRELPDLLSPFAHIVLQAELGRCIDSVIKETHGRTQMNRIEALQNGVRAWIKKLPAIFRLEDATTTFDDDQPHLVFQRRQLHLTIYMTLLSPLRPYLATSPRNHRLENFQELRARGVQTSLQVLETARILHDIEQGISPKFHLVIFCTFDTATLLCSALIHDSEDVPCKEQIHEALESALDILLEFSQRTKIGTISYNFLFQLVKAVPFLAKNMLEERSKKTERAKKRRRVGGDGAGERVSASEVLTSPGSGYTNGDAKEPNANSNDPTDAQGAQVVGSSGAQLPLDSVEEDAWFSLDQFLQNPGVENSELDMGGLEQIWDWDNLNIDALGR
jgi:hypothetical protein